MCLRKGGAAFDDEHPVARSRGKTLRSLRLCVTLSSGHGSEESHAEAQRSQRLPDQLATPADGATCRPYSVVNSDTPR